MNVVVVNNTDEPIFIKEIQKRIPCNGRFYIIPENVALMYSGLFIVPEPIIKELERLKNEVKMEREKVRIERLAFEKEKETYEPFINKIKIEEERENKEWKNNIKRHWKPYPLDFLYPFDFDDKEIDGAIERLRYSIMSIAKQKVRICVCNTSKTCIQNHIKDLAEINYFHKPFYLKKYCKPKTINLGVKKLVRTGYFLLSDIDLIYPPKFVEEIFKYTYYPRSVRVVFHNYNLGKEVFYKQFLRYEKIFQEETDKSRTRRGIAPGNGLINLNSFKTIKGFDEKYVGYGPEDADFNMRISYVSKYIEVDSSRLNTYHLYHMANTDYEGYTENCNRYDKKRSRIYSEVGTEKLNTFKIERDLHLLR